MSLIICGTSVGDFEGLAADLVLFVFLLTLQDLTVEETVVLR
jgi:hypothetical protein